MGLAFTFTFQKWREERIDGPKQVSTSKADSVMFKAQEQSLVGFSGLWSPGVAAEAPGSLRPWTRHAVPQTFTLWADHGTSRPTHLCFTFGVFLPSS